MSGADSSGGMPATLRPPATAVWPLVLCLVGLDYFSTLAYQPTIAITAAGRLAPFATLLVVLVTFAVALPVYWYLAGRSPEGRGAIGLLNQHLGGWRGKVLILLLLGFAATGFVITKSLSAADGAVHVIGNPAWQPRLEQLAESGAAIRDGMPGGWLRWLLNFCDLRVAVTAAVAMLGFAFWAVLRHGFNWLVFRLAAVVVGLYLLLTAVVLACAAAHLATHPETVRVWYDHVAAGNWGGEAGTEPRGWGSALAVCLLAFPKLAFSLAGFQLTMIVMPHIERHAGGRVRNSRKLLLAAAALMSLYLLATSFVTAVLIDPADAIHGPAAHRGLAYLAHDQGPRLLPEWLAGAFGTLYDLSTVAILALAGASVMVGLKDLVPRYLLQFGMEFEWAHKVGATMHAFNGVILLVAVLFDASVEAQRGAFSTAVLVLFTAGALACRLAACGGHRRDIALNSGNGEETRPDRRRFLFGFFAWALLAATLLSLWLHADGLLIALTFVLVTFVLSLCSRSARSLELRFAGFDYVDERSEQRWGDLKALRVPVLVPHRPGRRTLKSKEADVRRWHRLDDETPLVFIEATVGDPSEFEARPLLEVQREDGRVTLHVSRCASVANVIAAVALELSGEEKPLEIHFGWSDDSPLRANLSFMLLGEGNVPWLVREIIRRSVPQVERRPRIILG